MRLTGYVLFLVTTAMFFDRSKIPSPVVCRIPQGTFITSLVPIAQIHVVSAEKIFERNTLKIAKKNTELLTCSGKQHAIFCKRCHVFFLDKNS